jgi:hypothetical protein
MGLKLALTLGLFALSILFGFWLSHSGKPLNPLLLTVHKLISLSAVILAILTVMPWQRSANLHALTLTLLVAIGLFILTLFITGALLSLGKPLPGIVLTVHQLATVLLVLSTAAVIWKGIGT